MPSRASTSFLLIDIPFPAVDPLATCQCPLGLVPHFYFLRGGSITNSFFMCVNALSGQYLISTKKNLCDPAPFAYTCQCPLGLVPHFYISSLSKPITDFLIVSMPSRASTSFLRQRSTSTTFVVGSCQCPLGLVPHFYEDVCFINDNTTEEWCQCPLGLVPHFYNEALRKEIRT